MRFFSHLLFLVIVLSCSGMTKKPTLEERPKPNFPDTELKQVIIRGNYYPADPEKVKEIERDYRKDGLLKEVETLKEKYPREFERKEGRYDYTNEYYCYNEVKIEDRESCYKDNLKVRIYDKEGRMITEDCLRLEYPDKYDGEGEILGEIS